MKLNVNGCEDCPFRYTKIDCDVVGFDTLEMCMLNHFLGKEYFIDCYDSWKQKKKYKIPTPAWCPLTEEIKINKK